MYQDGISAVQFFKKMLSSLLSCKPQSKSIQPIQLLILDQNLPGMQGTEVIKELNYLYKRAQFRMNKNFDTNKFGKENDTYQMYKPYSVLLTSVP